MFGQRALSHTVWSPCNTGFMREIVSALLSRTLSHSGRRGGAVAAGVTTSDTGILSGAGVAGWAPGAILSEADFAGKARDSGQARRAFDVSGRDRLERQGFNLTK
jgi:hypothetical protein